MSGNGPIGYPGTRPPVRRPLADDPYTAPPRASRSSRIGRRAMASQRPHTGISRLPPATRLQSTAADLRRARGARLLLPTGCRGAAGLRAADSGHQLPFGNPAAPAIRPAAQQAQTVRGARRQGYDLGQLHVARAGVCTGRADPFQQGHDAGLQQHPHDASQFGAPHRATARPTPTSTRCWPRKRKSRAAAVGGMMIAAALVGAIGLGGAMAYTYKILVAPRRTGARGQGRRFRAQQDQARGCGRQGRPAHGQEAAQPARRGGQRASCSRGRAAAQRARGRRQRRSERPAQGEDHTHHAGRSTAGDDSKRAPAAHGSAAWLSVPGVMLSPAMPVPQAGPPQGPPPSAARVQLPAAGAAPSQGGAAAAPSQGATCSQAAAGNAPDCGAGAPARAPVGKPPCRRGLRLSTRRLQPSMSGASGYVAVLSSKKSRMDALKAFADIQQKYGDVLGSKTPDVQEADLGDKGLWYRAVVGPPGSREAASAVCSQLKTAGHAACWVTAY